MKTEKISKLVLAICIGIIVVCFALFMTVGYDNPVGDYNEPKFTNLLMWLMYIMAVATTVFTIWSIIRGVQNTKGGSGAGTGVPGGKIMLFTILLTVASFVIGYVFGIGEPDFTATDGTVTTGAWVTIVDAFCWSIGIMTVAAVVAVGISMSGMLSKSVK